MEVIPYKSAYREEWDRFVRNHEYSVPGHYSGLFDIEKELGGENCSYILLDGKKNLIGIMPMFLFKKRIKKVFKSKTLISGSTLRNGPLISIKPTRVSIGLIPYNPLTQKTMIKITTFKFISI